MMDEKLLKRFELIKGFYLKNSRMPSYSEMAGLFGFKSKNAVYKVVGKLIEEKVLRKDKKGRVVLVADPISIRVLGYVEAGFPSPAEEELLDAVSLNKFLIKNPNSTFMLKVSGDSMVEAGIMPGDFVLVDRSLKPKNGNIVIARVDGEWTIKYLRKRDNRFILVPANKRFETIIPKDELYIAGVVIGVIRKYR